jgi:hypothetical protein
MTSVSRRTQRRGIVVAGFGILLGTLSLASLTEPQSPGAQARNSLATWNRLALRRRINRKVRAASLPPS